jgi:hypothetical protein
MSPKFEGRGCGIGGGGAAMRTPASKNELQALDCTERSGKRGENASHERRGVLTSPLRKTGA